MLPLPDDFDTAAPDLLPVVRAAERVPDRLLRRDLGAGLVVAVAWDTPEVRRLVGADAVKGWGVREDAVFLEAFGNLYPEDGLVRRGAGFEVRTGDGYESSRLALPGWLAAFAGKVGGRPVAFVPHARALWVCAEAHAPRWVDDARAAFATEGEPICADPLVLDGGRLVRWG